MSELEGPETAARKFEDKLQKLIKRAKNSAGCSGPRSFPSSSSPAPMSVR